MWFCVWRCCSTSVRSRECVNLLKRVKFGVSQNILKRFSSKWPNELICVQIHESNPDWTSAFVFRWNENVIIHQGETSLWPQQLFLPRTVVITPLLCLSGPKSCVTSVPCFICVLISNIKLYTAGKSHQTKAWCILLSSKCQVCDHAAACCMLTFISLNLHLTVLFPLIIILFSYDDIFAYNICRIVF